MRNLACLEAGGAFFILIIIFNPIRVTEGAKNTFITFTTSNWLVSKLFAEETH
jgi:hypothetical protein